MSTTSTISPTTTMNASESQQNRRVRGLDTIRFILAMWVVFGHLGFVPLGIESHGAAGKIADGLYNNLFSGPAAVIVFFVISGFCIHYPFRHNKQLLLIPYFSRRHLRIWIPIIVAVLAAKPLGVDLGLLSLSILWSLIAEEIYYLLYPGLLFLKRKYGWRNILIAAYIGAFMVIMRDPRAGNYPSYGIYLNWLLGLPCWLLGCVLADKADALCTAAQTVKVPIWGWRLAAWILSIGCSMLRFHSPIKYPWTLTFFAIFAFFWLGKEIQYFQSRVPSPLFENAGKGSYSIYLVHLLGEALYKILPIAATIPLAYWFGKLAFVLFLCYVFYLVVERPSHLLARKVAEKLSPKQSATVVSQPA